MDHRLKCLRVKTIKFLDENGGINLCDLDLGSGFLDMMLKAQTAKEKENR